MFARISAVLLAVSLLSCGILFNKKTRWGPDILLSVLVARTANENHPVEVDVVMVYDDDMVDQLMELPAAEWFRKRYQFEKDSLGVQKIQFSSWEWAPGQEIDNIYLQFPKVGRAGIIYANYLTPGEHRVRVDPIAKFQIVVGEKELQVISLERDGGAGGAPKAPDKVPGFK